MSAACCLLAPSALAQMTDGLPHPHIANFAPVRTGLHPPYNSDDASPLFNVPDGVWNNGEGFKKENGVYVPDTGGWHGLDEGAEVSLDNVFQYYNRRPLSGPWQPQWNAVTGASRFCGYLRDQELPANIDVDDAAFEIFATSTFNPSVPTVIVIVTRGTIGPDPVSEPHSYPGLGSPEGIPTGSPVIVQAAGNQANVIDANILPRTSGRPAIFQMQRNLQLLEVIKLMLADPAWCPPSWSLVSDPAIMITGASFGGWTSQLSVMLYPERFHGAYARSLGGSMQRTVGEQEFWTWQNALCGFGDGGTAFSSLDTLRWAGFLKQKGRALGFDLRFVDVSLTRRFRDGTLYRPVFFQIGDEDVTSTGATWIPLLHGNRTYLDYHTEDNPNGRGFSKIYWAIMDRRNHENGWYTLPFTGQRTKRHEDGFVPMMTQAVLSKNLDPPLPGQFARVGPDVDATEDPYDHVHAREVFTAEAPTGSLDDKLIPDPVFEPPEVVAAAVRPGKSYGYGTWLGADDSMIATDSGDVFVGSAEGVVTRFRFDSENPATYQLVAQDMSVALGYGAWALALGDVISNGTGVEELVVGTYRDLYVLDAYDLSAAPLLHYRLEFDESRPRRMQLADVFPQISGNEIIFQSHMGQISVYHVDPSGSLGRICTYPEAGVQDLLVHPGVMYAPGAGESAAITLLSRRGHLANITLDDQVTTAVEDQAQLYAWSPLMMGYPVDLEDFSTAPEIRRVAALHTKTAGGEDSIAVFDAATMAPINWCTFDPGDELPFVSTLPKIDMEIATQGSTRYFVVLTTNRLYLISQEGGLRGALDLTQLAPAVNAVDIAVADIAPGPSQFDQEVVLSTQAGQVVWLRLDYVVAGSVPPQDRWSSPHLHTHPALVATWGMVEHAGKLELVDQTGTRWRVDPAASPVTVEFQHELYAWSTTNGQNRPADPIESSVLDLRTVTPKVTGSDLCTVRAIADPSRGGQPLVVAGTPGGSVVLLAPDFSGGRGTRLYPTLPTGTEAEWDFGHGGCALALRATPEAAPDSVQIFFGPVIYHPDPSKHRDAGSSPTAPNESERLVSAIYAFTWNGSSVQQAGPWILEAGGALPAGDPGGFGLCGLCLGDLFPERAGPELIATTLDGDLFVFAIDGSGITELLYRTKVEGALGAFNSIIVNDLDQDTHPELYVAGSLGLRKFTYVPSP